MPKKRSLFLSPFTLYMDMWKAGMQASQLFSASTEVISHRSDLIGQALSGHLPWTDPEFARMWQEKVMANYAAWNAMSGHLAKPSGDMVRQQLNIMASCMKPYHQKATSNAKRLRKSRSKK